MLSARLLGYAGSAVLACCVVAAGVIYASSHYKRQSIARAITDGDPSRAPALLRRYGCAGCHDIPGIAGADGQVGASLANLRKRVYIAGALTNTPNNLAQWIVEPRAFAPRTAMPATGITPSEARDVAAYLYAQ